MQASFSGARRNFGRVHGRDFILTLDSSGALESVLPRYIAKGDISRKAIYRERRYIAKGDISRKAIYRDVYIAKGDISRCLYRERRYIAINL